MPLYRRFVVSILVLSFALSLSAQQSSIADDLRAAALDAPNARKVAKLDLVVPMGKVHLESGILFPTSPIAGAVGEFVFLGKGTLTHSPTEAVERRQLTFFTGSDALKSDFETAVFVVPNDDAAAAFLRLPRADDAEKSRAKAAAEWTRWKNGTERKLLGVEGTLFADSVGDPLQRSFFAVFARDEILGDFVYSFDAAAREQLTIAQFLPLDATEKQKRKLKKALDRQQRQGRFIGVTVDDLGEWDVWVSSSDQKNGKTVRGVVPFEAKHYELEVTLDPGQETLEGKATITVRATTSVVPAATFHLPPTLLIKSVSDKNGKPLTFHRTGGSIVAQLPAIPATNEETVVVIEYGGKFLERSDRKTTVPLDSLAWHPRIGDLDSATYDVTYRWRGNGVLVAGGEKAEAAQGSGNVERRRLTTPTIGTTFALGSFKIQKFDAGAIKVSLALDGDAFMLEKKTRDEVISALRESIVFFQEKFGPLSFKELNVVNVPRDFSQSLAGIITLSTGSLGEYDLLAPILQLEDRRTVVAHEVAHFWWGHLVGFESYRDQWMSEALANYSAGLFSREKLDWTGRYRVEPTTGWRQHLSEQLDNGLAVEAVGPVVLGARLDSSKATAYTPIVYEKGALIIAMMAQRFGEDAFHQLLATVARVSAGRPLTTEDLVEIWSKAAKTDFAPFANQFIYGTGLPVITYSYSFTPAGDRKWRVAGEAVRTPAVESRFKVVRLPNGKFDVVTQRVRSHDTANETLVVPVKIGVNREGDTRKLNRQTRKEYEKIGNATVNGRMFLDAERTPFDFDVEHEPKLLWLDREEEVLARFLAEERSAKRILVLRAQAHLADGRIKEAEAALRGAIAAADTVDTDLEIDEEVVREKELLKIENEWLDVEAHLMLAELHLSRGDFAAMTAEIEQTRKSLSRGRRGWVDDEVLVLELRAQMLKGETEQAFNRLEKFVLKRSRLDDGQAHALLAIAAKETGHKAEFEQALERARRRGVDVTLLH